MADDEIIYPIDTTYSHTFPLNDLRVHVLVGPDCPCKPEIKLYDAHLLVVHNSFDHREIVEEAIRIMNGEDE